MILNHNLTVSGKIVVMEMMASWQKKRFIHKAVIVFCLFSGLTEVSAAPKTVDVAFLTHSGSRNLKSWDDASIESFAGKKTSSIRAQEFLFDESAKTLGLNDLASIDLVTIITDSKTIRVPRFLIWRGFFHFKWNPKTKILSSHLKNNQQMEQGRIILPSWYFEADAIRKIELSDHQFTYPNTKLNIRTNPAASRGEKVFTQNCLACHAVTTYGSPVLSPIGLNAEKLATFGKIHQKWPDLKLDPRLQRGLIEYSEALAFEKNDVKLKK